MKNENRKWESGKVGKWAALLALLALLTFPSAVFSQATSTPIFNLPNASTLAGTNYLAVLQRPNATNGTVKGTINQLIALISVALTNQTGTNLSITNITSLPIFDQINQGVWQFRTIEIGTNMVGYYTPTSIVLNGQPGGGAASTNFTTTAHGSATLGSSTITNGLFLGAGNNGSVYGYDQANGRYFQIFLMDDTEMRYGTNGFLHSFLGSEVSPLLDNTTRFGDTNFRWSQGWFNALYPDSIKITGGQPSGTIAILDGNTNVIGWISTNVFGNVSGATNGLTTRVNNLDGATNALNTRMANAEAATNLISSKQHGTAALTNLSGTVGNNVTNVISLSTSNATSQPLTNSYGSGTLRLYGIEAGANVTIGDNGSNKVISATSGSGVAYKTNAQAIATENSLNFTNGLDIFFVATDQVGTRVDLEARIQNDAVTFAKMQNVTTDRLIGRDTASTGDPEEIALDGTTLEFTGSASIRRSALAGDVTASAGSATTTIAANAVTDAKLRDSGGLSVIGRSVNSAGDPGDITAAANGYVLWRTNNALLWGRVTYTNDSFANLNFLNLADGDLVTFHGASGMFTNRQPTTNYPNLNVTRLITSNVISQVTTNLGTNAAVTFDLTGPAIGHFGIYGDSTISLTNVPAFTNTIGARPISLVVRQVGVSGTLTIAPIGPHAINWDEGAPFIASNATNDLIIYWDGLQLRGFNSHAGYTGSGVLVYSNAPSIYDPRFTAKNATSNYVWTCTNSTTGEGEWRTTSSVTNYNALNITNALRFGETNVIVSSTAVVLLDLAQFTLFKISLLTNATFIFTNVGAGLQRAQCVIQQDTNGQRTTAWSVAGGLIQTNASLQATTNANALDILEVSSSYFSTNLLAWWPQNFQPRVAFTNSLYIPTLYTESFEGAGYENASTETQATIDEDDTTAATSGTQNLKVTQSVGSTYVYPDAGWTPAAVTTYDFSFQVDTVGSDNQILQVDDTPNGSGRGYIYIQASGAVRIYGNGAGSVNATTVGTVSANTQYYCRATFNKTAGTYQVEFQTTHSFTGSGNNFASNNNGDTGTTIGDLRYYSAGTGYVTKFDQMVVTSP